MATYEQLPTDRNTNFFYILNQAALARVITSKSVVKNSVLPTAAIIRCYLYACQMSITPK
jgi:hypothetical protein